MKIPHGLKGWAAAAVLVLAVGVQAAHVEILSLNGSWFPGRTREASAYSASLHLRQVQQLLADRNPDVFLMQEVRDREAAEALLAVLPDLTLHTMTDFGEGQELLVASRFPAVSVWAEAWTERADGAPPRGFASAVLHLPGGRALAVYTVHFKSNFAEEDTTPLGNAALREEAARQLADHADWLRHGWWGHPLEAVVVGGDINTTYPSPIVTGEQTFPILEGAGFRPFPLDSVDHFVVLGTTDGVSATSLSGYAVSDHDPILLRVPLPGADAWARAEPQLPTTLASLSGDDLRIDLNTAASADLEQLPGIGPVMAERIMAGRPYRSVRELDRVKGIGPKTLGALADRVRVDSDANPGN